MGQDGQVPRRHWRLAEGRFDPDMQFLRTPDALLAVLIIASCILVSVAGMIVVRRRVSYETLKDSRETASNVFGMVGGLYAILLGFMIVVVWQQYNEAQTTAEQEALRVGTLLRDARVFDADTQARMRERLIGYAKTVVADEWKTMPSGQASKSANDAYERLWNVYYDVQPQTDREKVFYQSSIGLLNELSSLRHSRIISSQAGVPSALWVLLIVGGVVVVAFTYLFGTKSAVTQTLIVSSLSGLIGFLLFLILALDYCFSGDLGIKPDALQKVLEVWGAG